MQKKNVKEWISFLLCDELEGIYFRTNAVRRIFFFREGGGGKIIYNIRGENKRGSEVTERERGIPLLHEGAFAFSKLKMNDLVHTLGGIL